MFRSWFRGIGLRPARKPSGSNEKATTYTPEAVPAAKAGDHVEIAVEAEDGTKFKITATAEQLATAKG